MNLALLLKYQRRKRKKYVISALLSLLKEKRKSKTCMYVTFTVRQTYSGPLSKTDIDNSKKKTLV